MIITERTRPTDIPGRARKDAIGWDPAAPKVAAIFIAFVLGLACYYAFLEAPTAVKHDMSEAYAWGQEYQLGYNQHPPFWAWVCALWFEVFPHTQWAFGLLSALNAGIGLWGAWCLIGDFTLGPKRVAAWSLLILTPLYTAYAYKYNANIIFLSIWPWTAHYFMRSVQSRRPGDAIAFGVCVAVALLSKYYALILVATCFLALLQHPARWRYLTSRSPYVSVAVTVALFAPHAWWLLANEAPPLRYLSEVSDQQWHTVLDHAWRTFSGVVGMNLSVVAVVLIGNRLARRKGQTAPIREIRRPMFGVLTTLALAPIMLTLVSALVLRNPLTDEMTVGIFPLVPLLVIELLGRGPVESLGRLSVRLATALMLGAVVLSPAVAAVRTWYSPVAMKVLPFEEVALDATRLWHERTGKPVGFVAGSPWFEDATAFYSPDHPSAFAYFDYDRSLWVTPERLAERGLLSICRANDATCLTDTAKFATPETTRSQITVAHTFWGHVARPVDFVVTIIPPRLQNAKPAG
jgi:4-amino-4-deoxy-L-arabinose transferase-like glycosyltransferase